MLPEGNPQWSGCARHLSEGLVQLLQRFYIEITDSRAICRASDQQGRQPMQALSHTDFSTEFLEGPGSGPMWTDRSRSWALRRTSHSLQRGQGLHRGLNAPGPWGVWKNSSASTAEPRQQRCLPSWLSSTPGCAAHRQHLQLLHLRALQQCVSAPPVQNETDTQVRKSICHYSMLHYSTISVRAKLLYSALIDSMYSI